MFSANLSAQYRISILRISYPPYNGNNWAMCSKCSLSVARTGRAALGMRSVERGIDVYSMEASERMDARRLYALLQAMEL
jgi:hypothetical protein